MISVVSKPRSDKFENFWTSSFGSRISVNLLISIQAMQCIFNVRSTSTISRMAALIGRDRATQKVDSIFWTKNSTQFLERTKVHSGHRAKMSSSPDSSSTPLTLQITRLDRKPDDPKVFSSVSQTVTDYFQSPVKNEIKEQPTFELKQFDFPSLAKGA